MTALPRRFPAAPQLHTTTHTTALRTQHSRELDEEDSEAAWYACGVVDDAPAQLDMDTRPDKDNSPAKRPHPGYATDQTPTRKSGAGSEADISAAVCIEGPQPSPANPPPPRQTFIFNPYRKNVTRAVPADQQHPQPALGQSSHAQHSASSSSVTGFGAAEPSARDQAARNIWEKLCALKPCRFDMCWLCGHVQCKGLSGCAQWKRLTGVLYEKPICFFDGGNHRRGGSGCFGVNIPNPPSGRCASCYLPQKQDLGVRFHIPHTTTDTTALEEEREMCRATEARHESLFLVFFRSLSLRKRFLELHRTRLGVVPSFFDAISGENASREHLNQFWTWMWQASTLRATLCNADLVLLFFYGTYVVKGARVPLPRE